MMQPGDIAYTTCAYLAIDKGTRVEIIEAHPGLVSADTVYLCRIPGPGHLAPVVL